jgi:hypothetical protein
MKTKILLLSFFFLYIAESNAAPIESVSKATTKATSNEPTGNSDPKCSGKLVKRNVLNGMLASLVSACGFSYTPEETAIPYELKDPVPGTKEYQKAERESRRGETPTRHSHPDSVAHSKEINEQMSDEKWDVSHNGAKPRDQGGILKHPVNPSTVEISDATDAKGTFARPAGESFAGGMLGESKKDKMERQAEVNAKTVHGWKDVVKELETKRKQETKVSFVSDDLLPKYKDEDARKKAKEEAENRKLVIKAQMDSIFRDPL